MSFMMPLPASTELVIDVKTRLRGSLAEQLVGHAERLNRTPVALLADLVTHVLQDGLVDAVLDEPASRERGEATAPRQKKPPGGRP